MGDTKPHFAAERDMKVMTAEGGEKGIIRCRKKRAPPPDKAVGGGARGWDGRKVSLQNQPNHWLWPRGGGGNGYIKCMESQREQGIGASSRPGTCAACARQARAEKGGGAD